MIFRILTLFPAHQQAQSLITPGSMLLGSSIMKMMPHTFTLTVYLQERLPAWDSPRLLLIMTYPAVRLWVHRIMVQEIIITVMLMNLEFQDFHALLVGLRPNMITRMILLYSITSLQKLTIQYYLLCVQEGVQSHLKEELHQEEYILVQV